MKVLKMKKKKETKPDSMIVYCGSLYVTVGGKVFKVVDDVLVPLKKGK